MPKKAGTQKQLFAFRFPLRAQCKSCRRAIAGGASVRYDGRPTADPPLLAADPCMADSPYFLDYDLPKELIAQQPL
ncbi:MAG: hypothetical protein AAF589_03665, partial [Planctomycetota bacterium]